jgi:hypothetical protein
MSDDKRALKKMGRASKRGKDILTGGDGKDVKWGT